MVDRAKRDKLAEKLRHLLSGRIDNLQFDALDEDDSLNSEDEVISRIFYSMWRFYDDFRSHPLRLTEGQRHDFIRCIVFLHSDLEYEWPSRRDATKSFFRRLLARLGPRRDPLADPAKRREGDMRVFPFYRKSDYSAALKTPRLLSKSA